MAPSPSSAPSAETRASSASASPSPERRAKGVRALRRFELAALGLVALWALWFQLRVPSHRVPETEYRQVAAKLSQEARPGDAVLLYPWWTERARIYLPKGMPVVGYLDSDVDPLIDHPRIWVLAEPKLPKSDLEGFLKRFSPGRKQVGAWQDFGHLSLALFENGHHRPARFDAVEHVADAEVFLERGSDHSDCSAGAAHRCVNGETVAAEWHELFYAPHRCLHMQAPGGPARVVAEWTGVPSAPLLRLSAGIIWEHAARRDAKLTPLHVQLEEVGPGGARPLSSLTIDPGTEGAQLRDVPLEGTSPHTVRVSVQSDNSAEREACVELTAYGEAAR